MSFYQPQDIEHERKGGFAMACGHWRLGRMGHGSQFMSKAKL
jgi:hypothetical protein